MKVRILDYPTRLGVTSEEEPDREYAVDLVANPRGVDENGNAVFNGSCGLGRELFNGCKDFLYRCEPKLKDPRFNGQIFRCKHIREARANCLDYLLPKMREMDPNQHEDNQT